MCELRTIGAELTSMPLVPTPPLSAVQARANGYVAARRRRSALVMSVVVGLTMTGVLKLGMGPGTDAVRMVGTPPGEPDPSTTTTTVPPTGLSGLDATTPFLPWSGQTFDGSWTGLLGRSRGTCPDMPVNPKLPSIKVLSNPAFAGVNEPQPYAAALAVIDWFNDHSSICGRAIELVSGGQPTTDVVAVLGMPLDAGLDAGLADRRFERAGVPVIGGDGLSAVQHRSPVMYPVGTSAAALTRTAAHQSWESGARTFAIVYDANRPLGTESAAALADYVRRAGGTLKASIGIDSTAVDPRNINEFEQACANRSCDTIILALLPDVATDWLLMNPQPPRLGITALPTLLTTNFADACFRLSNDRCNGLTAWSGFIPPFGVHTDNLEAANGWHRAWGEPKGSAMVEAAVVSTRVLLEALVEAGPRVTRASLLGTLDNLTFTSLVTSPLRWPRGAIPRIGNPASQAWRLVLDQAARPEDAEPTVQAAAGIDGRTVDRATTGQAPHVPAPSVGPPPGREWHESGTGWRSDPQ